MTTTTFPAFADPTVPFVAPTPSSFGGLSDDAVVDLQRTLGELRRRVDAVSSAVAGELARRSRHDLGFEGLAQRLGARTPEALIARVTGTSTREAAALVRVGSLVADAEQFESRPTGDGESPSGLLGDADPAADGGAGSDADSGFASSWGSGSGSTPTPWLHPVAHAVNAGRLSVGAADAIRTALRAPGPDVSAAALDDAVAALIAEAGTLTPEQLAARARDARAELDEASVQDRERELRERRYLRLVPQPDGMTRVHGLLDPESAAIVVASVDAATSPRRGGPRFVDSASIGLRAGRNGGAGHSGRSERSVRSGRSTADASATEPTASGPTASDLTAAERAERLVRDPRATDQIALDALVELIRLGTTADDGTVLGARTPAVRVLVTDADLARRRGAGHLEGQSAPVSIPSVERRICADGTVPIHFDSGGQVVNVGRDQRLFTARQRIGLAARDGGCRFPGCERPPSWCEAHHIVPWHREHGRTDISDGVLLCRHHHLLVHDNGWRITRDGAYYSAIPPRTLDPAQRPISMPSRSPAARRLAG